MNERIRELAEQAGWTEGYYESDEGPFIEPEFNKEKFAELIVRECMILVKDCYKEPESGQSPYQTVCASTIIEEHFGVEE